MKEIIVTPTKIHRIENKDKYKSANTHYNLVVSEDVGRLEFLLFTDSDIEEARKRAQKNTGDIPRIGYSDDNVGYVYSGMILLGAAAGIMAGILISRLFGA